MNTFVRWIGRCRFHWRLASPASAQVCCPSPCQTYRLEYQTVCEQHQITAYRIEYETVCEERQVTSYRPVWETASARTGTRWPSP